MAEIPEEFLKYRLLSERPGQSGVELELSEIALRVRVRSYGLGLDMA